MENSKTVDHVGILNQQQWINVITLPSAGHYEDVYAWQPGFTARSKSVHPALDIILHILYMSLSFKYFSHNFWSPHWASLVLMWINQHLKVHHFFPSYLLLLGLWPGFVDCSLHVIISVFINLLQHAHEAFAGVCILIHTGFTVDKWRGYII